MPAGPAIAVATLRALAEGGRRFDAGRYFEAHEAWEDAWRAEAGAVRLQLQGLIQVAAAFHKGLVQGVPRGMVKLLDAGLEKVDAAGSPGLPGVEVFRAACEPWREAARRWAEGGAPPRLEVPRFAP